MSAIVLSNHIVSFVIWLCSKSCLWSKKSNIWIFITFHQHNASPCKTILKFRQFNLCREKKTTFRECFCFCTDETEKIKIDTLENKGVNANMPMHWHLHFVHVRTTNVIFDSVQWKLNKQMPKYLMPSWCSWCRPYVRVLSFDLFVARFFSSFPGSFVHNGNVLKPNIFMSVQINRGICLILSVCRSSSSNMNK